MKKLLIIFAFIHFQSFSQTNVNQFKWVDGPNITNEASRYGASSNGPGARLYSVEWELNGKLYLFGGQGPTSNATTEYLNDLWAYDPATNNWTWLKGYNGTTVPNSTGSYGTIGVPSSTNLPLGRGRAMTWSLNNKLYLMGGEAGGGLIYNDLWEYDPVTNNWTWIKGSNTSNNAGNYGTIGVESSTNIPGARSNSSNWVVNGKFYLFGGVGIVSDGSGGGRMNDLWSYNPATNNWTYIKGSLDSYPNGTYGSIGVANTNNTPSGRADGNAWVYNNKLYLMGGIGRGAQFTSIGGLNDLWSFDISTNNWTWLKGSSTVNPAANFGSIGVSSSINIPPAKSNASTWTYNGKLYLFGASGSFINDLWEYNPSTNNWTWLKGGNSGNVQGQYGSLGVTTNTNMPGGRTGGSSWVYNNKLYLFGGSGLATTATAGYLNDLWEYDALTNNFTWIKGRNVINKPGIYDAPQRPGARINSMTWSLGNKFYLFGGYGKDENGEEGNMNDFWEYNPSTSTWNWLKGSKFNGYNGIYGTINVPNASNMPTSRFSANTWTYNNKLYMFGGTSGFSEISNRSFEYNDLWEYNPITNIWTWIKGPLGAGFIAGNYGTFGVEAINNIPGARESATIWTYSNKTYLFGGKYTTGVQSSSIPTLFIPSYSFLNDLWVYNHTTNNWTWLKGANSPGQAGIYNNANGFETPGAREKSTAVSINGKAYLFGGTGYAATSSGYLNDLWEYNIATNLWLWKGGSNSSNQIGNYGIQGIAINTNIPGSRYFAFAWEFNNKFFMMGGFGFGNNATSAGNLNDLWEYKPTTNMWTWLKGSFSTEQGGNYGTINTYNTNNIPGAREGSSSIKFNNKLYLFGGYGYGSGIGAGLLNDLWEYTPACTDVYSVSSGNWNNASTWSCGQVPTSIDRVEIKANHVINLNNSTYTFKSLLLNGNITLGQSSGTLKAN